MNVYAEAVKKGGDYWTIYLPEELLVADAKNRITPAGMDDFRMLMAERYPETRRAFQTVTYGPL